LPGVNGQRDTTRKCFAHGRIVETIGFVAVERGNNGAVPVVQMADDIVDGPTLEQSPPLERFIGKR
jgi:hypothetical protein